MQDKLDIKNKTRSNLLRWSAQFSPELIEHFLDEYSRPGDVVLDPFVGSGTVLVESARLNLECVGSEINPAAVKLSNIYMFCNLDLEEREQIINKFNVGVRNLVSIGFVVSIEEVRKLIHSHYFNGQFEKIMLDSFIVLLDINKGSPSIERRKIYSAWNKLVQTILSLPEASNRITVLNADARKLPIETNSVDLVITSPPYINVFNYHEQYRGSVELLGYDILDIAKSEIGANRKNRGNRFKTVTSYCYEISDVMRELCRVTKEGSRIIFVVGRQSKILGVPFFNGEIVSEIADKLTCIKLIEKQERKFRNKFGQLIYEDILHFANLPHRSKPTVTAATLAADFLSKGLEYTEEKSTQILIKNAISHATLSEQGS